MKYFAGALWLLAGSLCAPAQTPAPAFDVVSVKVDQQIGGRHHIWSSSSDANFRTENVTLKELLQWAYDLPETQILGITGPISDAKFDVDAKSDDALNAAFKAMKNDDAKAQKRHMVQALLADRFALKAHQETRELPVYALEPAKGGAKLPPTKSNGLQINSGYGRLSTEGLTTEGLARELAKIVGRVVEDKTGLDGRYDINLKWTPDEGPAMLNGAPIPDPPPGIFTAVEEQLGLKLVPTKGPVPVLVVDSVTMPSAN